MSATPIIALDAPSASDALALVDVLGPRCRFYKIGSELFTAAGPDIVRRVRATGAEVFLDLKFHDIPNTVRGAVRAAAVLDVALLTVHASGGRAMIEAAVASAGQRTKVLAVSVLTSLDADALGAAWGRAGVDVKAEVLRLADLASASGAHGLVCAGAEAPTVRARHGDRLALLIPGVRLPGADAHDQSRIVTPKAAIAAGATYLVIGRAVTAASDPAAAMELVLGEI
jgi:orotidine-5'-phosphate decarboxylase